MNKSSFFTGNEADRCEILAKHIITTRETVRTAAVRFNLSKSTVHKDVTARLEKINPALYTEVRAVLDKNKAERHLRGGYATKIMYQQKKKLFFPHF